MIMDDELFECDICCEKFEEVGIHTPLVLPCGHTLCRQCVENLHTQVCPTCKHPLHESSADSVVLPRNNWLVRCLVAYQHQHKLQNQNQNQNQSTCIDIVSSLNLNKPCRNVPKPACIGQRVLFKKLDKGREQAGRTAQSSEQREAERRFLMNLSRICKEKKIQNPDFDQKRFVKEGLIMKFGEEKAQSILLQVYDRIKVIRDRRNVSAGATVSVV